MEDYPALEPPVPTELDLALDEIRAQVDSLFTHQAAGPERMGVIERMTNWSPGLNKKVTRIFTFREIKEDGILIGLQEIGFTYEIGTVG